MKNSFLVVLGKVYIIINKKILDVLNSNLGFWQSFILSLKIFHYVRRQKTQHIGVFSNDRIMIVALFIVNGLKFDSKEIRKREEQGFRNYQLYVHSIFPATDILQCLQLYSKNALIFISFIYILSIILISGQKLQSIGISNN